MTNGRIHIVSLILNFADVVLNVRVIDQRPSADEKMLITGRSHFRYFGDSGEFLGLSGIIFNVFGAQLRKSKSSNEVVRSTLLQLLSAGGPSG